MITGSDQTTGLGGGGGSGGITAMVADVRTQKGRKCMVDAFKIIENIALKRIRHTFFPHIQSFLSKRASTNGDSRVDSCPIGSSGLRW